MAMALNLQDVATRDDRLIGTVGTISPSIAESRAIDYLSIITAPSAQDTIVLHAAGIHVVVI